MLNLLWNKYYPPSKPQADFTGQVVLVTGANVGLGLETVAHYVRLNAAKVILASRNIEKGERAKTEIEARSDCAGVISVWKLDMNTFEGVKTFVKRVEAELPCLDIAVLNAGLHVAKYSKSPEGWEDTLQVNTLSTALLAVLLLPILERSTAKPHLHIVSSTRHRVVLAKEVFGKPNLLLKFNDPKNFDPFMSYNVSKLLIVYFIRELADKKGKESSVVINCSCPGAVRTDLGRDFDTLFFRIFKFVFFSAFSRTPEEGSRTFVNATLLGSESQGEFFYNDQIQKPVEIFSSLEGQKVQKQVWNELSEVLRKASPEVARLV